MSAPAGSARRTTTSTSRALLRACHPEPTAAVTLLTAALAVAVDLSAGEVLLVVAAVLTGQLSIGWSNDLLDRRRDASSARADKPLAAGELRPGTVRTATALALVATVATSLALGPGAGLAHLGVVAGGWAYNLGLKGTVASWLPYAVSFGLLPCVPVLAAGGDPPAWLAAAGALLGVGAHLFNALPDVEDDARTGVRGLPVRLGRLPTRVAGCLLLVSAVAVLVLLPEGPPGAAGWATLAVASALALAAALDGGERGTRRGFLLAVATAAVAVALLASRASTLG